MQITRTIRARSRLVGGWGKRAGWIVAVLAMAGCRDNLNAPARCPDLCPGGSMVVIDTILDPIPNSDSAFVGYVPTVDRRALLVSSGLPAGEYRSFVGYPEQQYDSVEVDGVWYPLVVDTIRFAYRLDQRDSTATNIRILLHRIPVTTDTTISFSALEALMDGTDIVDTVIVPDSVKSGAILATLVGDEIPRFYTLLDGEGRLSVGLELLADVPTGIRIGAGFASSDPTPLIEVVGHIDIADVTKRRQVIVGKVDDPIAIGFVSDVPPPSNDLLYVGGTGMARSILRFDIPDEVLDSGQIIRATLELTPAGPILGLPNATTPDSVVIRGVLADLGAKSPYLPGNLVAGALIHGSTEVISIDMLSLAQRWINDPRPPATIVLAFQAERAGGSFMRPAFHSTRSLFGQPRLRLTYALPTELGAP